MSRKIEQMKYEDEIEKRIQKHFVYENREGYVFVGEEKFVMPVYYQDYMKDIDELQICDSDVFVASHPKAG